MDRPSLENPWSEGGFTFATNGRLIVAVERREDVPSREDAPKQVRHCLKWPIVSNPKMYRLKWQHPEIPDRVPCNVCKGTATVICGECESEIKCGDCHDGMVRNSVLFQVGYQYFNGVYLSKVMALPDVRFAVNYGAKGDAIYFQFSGGDGLLLPLLVEENETPDPCNLVEFEEVLA